MIETAHEELLAKQAQLEQRLVALERENKILREENSLLKKGLFGRRSERIDPAQLALFEGSDDGNVAPDEPAEIAVAPHRRKKKGHGRTPFAPHLPREVVECDVPEDERVCPDCGKAMQAIGVDTCERGHIVPARVSVKRYERKKYACPDGHEVKTAKAPRGVVEGAKYEASVYAHLLTAKYADHLPLNRLEGIFKRQGLYLPKQTMWDMLQRLDELVVRPVLGQMHAELLREPVLHSDETPITMRVEDGRGSKQGWAWLWRNLADSEQPKTLVQFRSSRSRDGPLDFLGDWNGTYIVDGFAGQNEVIRRNGIVRAGCWARARRKVKEALDIGTSEAGGLLRPIQRLFWVERAVNRRAEDRGLDITRKQALRADIRDRWSRPLLARIYETARDLEASPRTLPKSALAKAINYLLSQRASLSVFLDDPRILIHNNDAERDLRHLAVGRKNWLIFASEKGGDVGCRMYSLVLSAKRAGIDVEAYIENLLGRIDDPNDADLANYTPWAWAARAAASNVNTG